MSAWIFLLLFSGGYLEDCIGIRFVYLGVPGFVLKGEAAWLECGYDLEGNELYSVKWYKDNVEFYRYLPGDRPAGQMYKREGVFLDLHISNATHIFLHTSDRRTEGLYGCEVSTERPQFRTIKAEKELYVYVIPKSTPTISGMMHKFEIGSTINATCSFGPSKPTVTLTWYINGEQVPDTFKQEYTEVHVKSLQTRRSRLHLVVQKRHSISGRLDLQCKASAFLEHSKSSIEIIVNDHHIQHVTYVPPGQKGPNITGNVDRYSVGDTVDLNCSSGSSLERAQLRWFLNDNEVIPDYLSKYPPIRNPDGQSSMQLGLRFTVQREHFASDELRLRCTMAQVKVIEATTTEIVVVGPQKATDHLTSSGPALGWVCTLLMEFLLTVLTRSLVISCR